MHHPNAILGLHGLANKPPKEEKERWWKAAIGEGLRRNCGTEFPNLPFEFVYWADLRYDAPLADDRNLEPYYVDQGTGPFPGVSEDVAHEDTLSLADKIYRGIDWLQETTGLTPFDDALIEYRLDDLWGYLEDAAFRNAARSRFRDALERHAGSRILLVAHSMGSLIAYDVLRMLERDGAAFPIDHFVTMGAPLGLSDVKMKMEQEHGDLTVPRGVQRWSNLVDRHDIATVGEDVANAYAPNADGVRADFVSVINGYRRPRGDVNHHKSYGYLRTPAFSQAVHDFMAGTDAADAETAATAMG